MGSNYFEKGFLRTDVLILQRVDVLPQAIYRVLLEIRQLLRLEAVQTSLLVTQLPMDLLERKSRKEIGVRFLL